jgi:hypothetical protein
MGLELPLALLGLLGVLIPVLAHRMRRRELQRVVLPTFALLSRAAAQNRRKRSLSDLLLLVLRAAIVVLACLGLAAPYVSSRVRFGDGHPANVAIVIDDSLSMSVREAGSTLIERARARALDVINALPEGSEVSVVLAGKPARVLVPNSRDLASARRALEAAELHSVRSGELAGAVELALRQLSRARAGARRLLVLSDFARHNAPIPAVDSAELIAERIGSAPQKPNLFISEAHAASDPTRPGEVSIAVEVRATRLPDQPEPSSAKLEVEVGGRRVASANLAFEHAAARSVLHVPADADGDAEALVHVIADDALDDDNRVAVLLGHSDAVRVLMVNGDPRPASRSDELYYVSRALSLVPDSLLSLRVQNVDPLSFEHADLAATDVVLLANAPPPSAARAALLLSFVQKGGGLIVAAGSRVDPIVYNGLLGRVLASHIRGLGRVPPLHFAPGGVPGFLPEGLLGLREVQTEQRLLLENGPADTLLAFEDGLPALTARSEGDGRTLLLATSLDTDFGDLPLRPGFMPLLAAMIRDAAGVAAAARTDLSPGDSVLLPVPRNAGFVEVRAPDGRSQRWAPGSSPEALRFSATDSLGVYRIRVGHSAGGLASPARDAFVVAPPRDESDLAPGPLPRSGPRTGRPAAAVSVHKPFAPALLLLLFACVALEGLVRARKRQAGTQSAVAA